MDIPQRNSLQFRQRPSPARSLQLPPVSVQQPDPQGLQHPRARIGRPGVAAADDDPGAARVERGPDELPDAVRRRRRGVPAAVPVPRNQAQPRRGRHVQDRRLPVVADQAEVGIDGSAVRARHPQVAHLAPVEGDDRLAEPLPAVVEGHLPQQKGVGVVVIVVVQKEDPAKPFLDAVGYLFGFQALLETRGCNQDP